MLLPRWVPGALGLVLRSKIYPLILGSVGRNVVFGVNVTLRHPHKIHIGDNVVIDDLCCLDAKGTDNKGIAIGNGVFVGRNTILSCKNGDIVIEDRANIGFNCEIFSASRVRVGKDILIAAYTYLVGGDHLYDRTDIPVLQQGRTASGIDVGDGTWLGTHVVVTDGSTIGRDAIIGAGAVVVGEIPEFCDRDGHPGEGHPRPARGRRRRRVGTDGRHRQLLAASRDSSIYVWHRRHRRARSARVRSPRTISLAWCGRCTIAARTKKGSITLPGVGARHAPPGDRRPGRRPAADPERDRRHQDRRQRRDLQLPRAAAGARGARPPVPLRATPTSR